MLQSVNCMFNIYKSFKTVWVALFDVLHFIMAHIIVIFYSNNIFNGTKNVFCRKTIRGNNKKLLNASAIFLFSSIIYLQNEINN